MHNLAIRAFLDRIYAQDEPEGLYLRLRVGPSQRKAQLIHSNIEIHPDSESMVEEILGYFEGWVYEEGDRCFLELMRARKSNPLDVVACLPSDIIETEELDDDDDLIEESAVKTLTAALVTLTQDANHRASISQQRFLEAVEVMVDSQIEMAHAQAQLAVDKDDTPHWVTALSAISPAFGPLIGDIAQKMQLPKPVELESSGNEHKPADKPAEESADPTDKPPIEPSARQPNPLDARG
jgi:hypothetical protein